MKRLFSLLLSFSLLTGSFAVPLAHAEEMSRKDLLLQRRELLRVIRSENNHSSRLGKLNEELFAIKDAIRKLNIQKRKERQLERKKKIELRRVQGRVSKKKLNLVKLPQANTSTTTQKASENIGNTEFGKASYYAAMFDGRTTASGEVFWNHMMTAAHKTLPFGTRVRVTNIANGKSIEVLINDRGPFVAGRIIDLTSTGFAALDNISRGVIDVKVDVLD